MKQKLFGAVMVHLDTGAEKTLTEKSKEALSITVDVWRKMDYAVYTFFES